MIRRVRARHEHVCVCGNYLVCTQELDQCRVIEPFDCPTCLDKQQEQEINKLAARAEQEPAHAHHR